MQRAILAALVIGVCLSTAHAATPVPTYPTCHMHKSRDVSFRNATSKDVLDVSIGTGPCYAATLTIIVRSVTGEVLYSYVAPFKRHTATHWEDRELDREAAQFVDDVIAGGIQSSASLPPYLDPTPYYEEQLRGDQNLPPGIRSAS